MFAFGDHSKAVRAGKFVEPQVRSERIDVFREWPKRSRKTSIPRVGGLVTALHGELSQAVPAELYASGPVTPVGKCFGGPPWPSELQLQEEQQSKQN